MFKGFLTDRPLYQHSSNFLRGLQLHQDYCAQKDFSTWAGKCPQVTRLGFRVEMDHDWDEQRLWQQGRGVSL